MRASTVEAGELAVILLHCLKAEFGYSLEAPTGSSAAGTDEPPITYCSHSELIFYSRVHSWCHILLQALNNYVKQKFSQVWVIISLIVYLTNNRSSHICISRKIQTQELMTPGRPNECVQIIQHSSSPIYPWAEGNLPLKSSLP